MKAFKLGPVFTTAFDTTFVLPTYFLTLVCEQDTQDVETPTLEFGLYPNPLTYPLELHNLQEAVM